jgi:hypothetical protein
MKLPARLILMITIVVTVTDVILYIHLKQHPEHLTVTFLILEIIVTIGPMAIIILIWHIRKWL